LDQLVGFDTQNGTGDEIACLKFLEQALRAYKPDRLILETVGRSRGKSDSGYVLAIWGQPKILLNVHIDTVPVADGWRTDPHKVVMKDDRAYGLGTSDIKGAAACILACLDAGGAKDVAVLFSGDEEHGSEVMPEVINSGHIAGIQRAIICEPTSAMPGKRHRGMLAFSTSFSGKGGHSSLADITERPYLDVARLAAKLGDYGDAHKDFGEAPYKGLCLNIGHIVGDGAYNVIPTTAKMSFSMRPPPGDDVQARRRDIYKIFNELGLEAASDNGLDTLVELEPFATRNIDGLTPYFAGLEPVDLPYWTEAALLSAAGVNAVVLGPGDVDQAHKPNEFVSTPQLMQAAKIYSRALSGEVEV